MGKETWNSRSEYIHNFARTLAGRLHIKSEQFRDCFSPQQVVAYLVDKTLKVFAIRAHLEYHGHGTDEMLGRLACCGRGSESKAPRSGLTIDEVVESHQLFHNWVSWNPKRDTKETQINMAILAIIAAMADNFYADAEMLREKERSEQEDLDRAMADYTHYGPNGPQLRP